MSVHQENKIFTFSHYEDMRDLSDEEMLALLNEALLMGWDINKKYGDEFNHYNMLHACAINGHLKSCRWLIQKGLDPNIRSGNGNTVLTYILGGNITIISDVNEILDLLDFLKSYHTNFSIAGYNNLSPIETYVRYKNKEDLKQPIVDYLIKNSDFENTFLLGRILINNNLSNIKNLKTIINNHYIDLKKVKFDEENSKNSETYWDEIVFNLKHKFDKYKYEYVSWLHEKLGFDTKSFHTIYDYDGITENKYKVNLLGFAMLYHNKNLYNWVLKREPGFVKDYFSINEKEYSMLEFSLIIGFRTGVLDSLRKMNEDELYSLNVSALKEHIREDDTLTLETFQKTYSSIIYKNMLKKYNINNNINASKKRLKV